MRVWWERVCRTETLRVFVCFRDLLHELEKCLADPVAIAECFVSKVNLHSRVYTGPVFKLVLNTQQTTQLHSPDRSLPTSPT